MTMRRYLMPLAVWAVVAVAAGFLWKFLAESAQAGWEKLLVYIGMCLLVIGAMAVAQTLLAGMPAKSSASTGTKRPPDQGAAGLSSPG